jgi:endogenous inhibitor of DNA gyrase (YacG/DUF329 family)
MTTATTPLLAVEPRMPETPCPYCARIMRWIDGKRPGSGWFECERCGTFDVQGWAPPTLPGAVCKSG